MLVSLMKTDAALFRVSTPDSQCSIEAMLFYNCATRASLLRGACEGNRRDPLGFLSDAMTLVAKTLYLHTIDLHNPHFPDEKLRQLQLMKLHLVTDIEVFQPIYHKVPREGVSGALTAISSSSNAQRFYVHSKPSLLSFLTAIEGMDEDMKLLSTSPKFSESFNNLQVLPLQEIRHDIIKGKIGSEFDLLQTLSRNFRGYRRCYREAEATLIYVKQLEERAMVRFLIDFEFPVCGWDSWPTDKDIRLQLNLTDCITRRIFLLRGLDIFHFLVQDVGVALTAKFGDETKDVNLLWKNSICIEELLTRLRSGQYQSLIAFHYDVEWMFLRIRQIFGLRSIVTYYCEAIRQEYLLTRETASYFELVQVIQTFHKGKRITVKASETASESEMMEQTFQEIDSLDRPVGVLRTASSYIADNNSDPLVSNMFTAWKHSRCNYFEDINKRVMNKEYSSHAAFVADFTTYIELLTSFFGTNCAMSHYLRCIGKTCTRKHFTASPTYCFHRKPMNDDEAVEESSYTPSRLTSGTADETMIANKKSCNQLDEISIREDAWFILLVVLQRVRLLPLGTRRNITGWRWLSSFSLKSLIEDIEEQKKKYALTMTLPNVGSIDEYDMLAWIRCRQQILQHRKCDVDHDFDDNYCSNNDENGLVDGIVPVLEREISGNNSDEMVPTVEATASMPIDPEEDGALPAEAAASSPPPPARRRGRKARFKADVHDSTVAAEATENAVKPSLEELCAMEVEEVDVANEENPSVRRSLRLGNRQHAQPQRASGSAFIAYGAPSSSSKTPSKPNTRSSSVETSSSSTFARGHPKKILNKPKNDSDSDSDNVDNIRKRRRKVVVADSSDDSSDEGEANVKEESFAEQRRQLLENIAETMRLVRDESRLSHNRSFDRKEAFKALKRDDIYSAAVTRMIYRGVKLDLLDRTSAFFFSEVCLSAVDLWMEQDKRMFFVMPYASPGNKKSQAKYGFEPMDLWTIGVKLKRGLITDLEQFRADLDRMIRHNIYRDRYKSKGCRFHGFVCQYVLEFYKYMMESLVEIEVVLADAKRYPFPNPSKNP